MTDDQFDSLITAIDQLKEDIAVDITKLNNNIIKIGKLLETVANAINKQKKQ